MMLTISNRTLTSLSAGLVIATVAGCSGAVSAATTPAGTHAKTAAGTPAKTAALQRPARQQRAATPYWTAARMRAAAARASARDAWATGDTLGDGLRWTHGGAVTRTTGKVFFTLHGIDYVCSGSVVSGPRADVVLTAAHCTGNGAGQWASHWTFVPGYTDGSRPYGSYTARRFYVSRHWLADQAGATARSEKYDVAFVTVNPAPGGRRLGAGTGGQPVSFSAGRSGTGLNGRDTYVFGYPSDTPFSGLYPDYCAGRARQSPGGAADGAAWLPCAMTAGDSGGPWFERFSPRTGTGTIAGVTTYKYGDGARALYGTVLGPDARSLYQAAIRGR